MSNAVEKHYVHDNPDMVEKRKVWAKNLLEKLQDIEWDYIDNLRAVVDDLEDVAEEGSAGDVAENVHPVLEMAFEEMEKLTKILDNPLTVLPDSFTGEEWCFWMHTCHCQCKGKEQE